MSAGLEAGGPMSQSGCHIFVLVSGVPSPP